MGIAYDLVSLNARECGVAVYNEDCDTVMCNLCKSPL